jgi:hypothetical protein
MTRGQIGAGIVTLALATGCAGMSSGGGSSSVDEQRYEAFQACQHFVNERLKAPSTAKYRDWFGDQKPAATGSGDGPFTIVSTVDSQNSFGAELRSSFTCTVTRSGDTWHAHGIHVG